SVAIMLCDNSHEWSARADSVSASAHGCPYCAGNYRRTAEDRERQLNDFPDMRFVRWKDGYLNKHSKAVMRCDKGHVWAASAHNLANGGTGCPTCARAGYDPSRPATLYALLSLCENYIKIGISGDYNRRHTELYRATPFEFSAIGVLHGNGYEIREVERMFHGGFESARFSGFNGATEWLKFDPQILSLLRILGA
ncbi:MAG: GIY-YIG nuclease family protein, partial [Aeromonadaceae bacterium]